jgi:hypothetical protein
MSRTCRIDKINIEYKIGYILKIPIRRTEGTRSRYGTAPFFNFV